MKRFIIALTMAFSVFTMSAFAIDGTINPRVQKSFESSFASAKDVKWSMVENLYLAEFSVDGQKVSAFYDVEGTLVATARHIAPQQLPISLQSSLKKRSEGYTLADIFEVNNQDGTSYYVTIDNGEKRIMLKSGVAGDWSVYKKEKK